MNIKFQSPNTILLCCGKKGCPSIVKESGDSYTLTDDFGGSVKLNKDELNAIQEAVTAFDNKKANETES